MNRLVYTNQTATRFLVKEGSILAAGFVARIIPLALEGGELVEARFFDKIVPYPPRAKFLKHGTFERIRMLHTSTAMTFVDNYHLRIRFEADLKAGTAALIKGLIIVNK